MIPISLTLKNINLRHRRGGIDWSGSMTGRRLQAPVTTALRQLIKPLASTAIRRARQLWEVPADPIMIFWQPLMAE